MLCSVTQLCLFATLWSLPGSSVLGVLQARILGCVAFPITGDLPDSGIEARSLASPAVDFFFTAVPPYLIIYVRIHMA